MSFLRKFDFGNEAGDDVDVHELKNYFVEQDKFIKLRFQYEVRHILTIRK